VGEIPKRCYKLSKSLEINSHRLNARRSNAPTGETDHQTGEAGHNGGNSEPIRESLLAQMSMSKETESATEPTLLTTAYIGYRLGQKARIRARHLEV
jgi:hypothetical protein